MSTKAALLTLIDTDLASDQPIIATQHRNVLKDDANSVLENIYATEDTDNAFTETFFTLSTIASGNASFTFFLLKQGAKIILSGTITSSVVGLTKIGTFNTGVYESSSNITYYSIGIKSGTTDIIGVTIFNLSGTTSLQLTNPLGIGETLNFSITYNSNS